MSCSLEWKLFLVISRLLNACAMAAPFLESTNLLQEQCPQCSWVIPQPPRATYCLTLQGRNFMSIWMSWWLIFLVYWTFIIEWHFSKGWAFYYISSWPFGTWSCESSANSCNLSRCTSPVTYHSLCSHIYSWSFASKKITQSDKGSSLACWLHY